MLGRLRKHLTRNVIGYVALFVALGGTAVALPGKGTVDRNDLRRGVVKMKNLKKGAVTASRLAKNAVTASKIKANAVTASKIKPNAVTTAKLKGKAVTAAKLADDSVGDAALSGGISELVHGNGQLQTLSGTANATGLLSTPVTLATIPGFGQVNLRYCSPKATGYLVRIQILSAAGSANFLHVAQGWSSNLPPGSPQASTISGSSGTLGDGGGSLVTATGSATATGITATFQVLLSRGTGAAATGAHVTVGVDNDGTKCEATAQTIIQK